MNPNKHLIVPKEGMYWEEGIYENTEMCYLWHDESTGQRCFILRMHPESRIPNHDHPRREIAYMLDGEIVLNDSDILKKGDFLTAGLGQMHDVYSEKGAELLIYIDYSAVEQKIVSS